MNILSNLRKKFEQLHENFNCFLVEHKQEANAVILAVQAGYGSLSGHERMDLAIETLLESLKLLGVFAVMASQKIVDEVEKLLQKQYEELKSEGKL